MAKGKNATLLICMCKGVWVAVFLNKIDEMTLAQLPVLEFSVFFGGVLQVSLPAWPQGRCGSHERKETSGPTGVGPE
jgi:hypothetical protein